MPFGLTSLVAWGSMALLPVLGLRAPAQVGAPSVVPSSATTALDATSQVAQAVLRKLQRDPLLEASGLSVAERNGIVELRGTVPVWPWRTRAARVASVVRHVRGVVNRINVVAVPRADSAVAADVRRAL